MSEVRIDRSKCQGHGLCYSTAPEVFEDDDEGYGVVVNEQVEGEALAGAQEGVDVCPERAISLS
jgi:ferredoxin